MITIDLHIDPPTSPAEFKAMAAAIRGHILDLPFDDTYRFTTTGTYTVSCRGVPDAAEELAERLHKGPHTAAQIRAGLVDPKTGARRYTPPPATVAPANATLRQYTPKQLNAVIVYWAEHDPELSVELFEVDANG